MGGTLTPLMSLNSGIAQAEGYGVSGAIPTLSNNPGDLELGDIGYGTTEAAGGNQITNFPSVEAGSSALNNLLSNIASGNSSSYSPNMTLSEFGNTYSGGNPNFSSNLSSILGVSPDTPISSLLSNSLSAGSNIMSTGLSLPGQNMTTGANSATGKISAPWWTNINSLIAVVLGVIFIGIGLMMFKTTQTIITTAVKTGAEATA